MTSKLLTLTALLSLAACDIPDKQIGDSDGGTTTDTGDGDGDGGPVDCELACGGVERECEFDSCCACAMAGGQLLTLESFPPQYACELGNQPLDGWEPPDCNWGECEDQVSELAIDEVFEPVGLTPQDVIDTIGAPMEAPHEWNDADVQLNVPGPNTMVAFTAVPNGGYRGIERIWVPPADLPDLEGYCDSTVQVDVIAWLTTTDGALDEPFAGVIQTTGDANIDLNPPSVWLRHGFPIDGFNGTLELSVDDPQSTIDPEAVLMVEFGRVNSPDADMTGGTLSTGVQTITEEWGSATWTQFGSWWVGG
jgi:hypothetical protein